MGFEDGLASGGHGRYWGHRHGDRCGARLFLASRWGCHEQGNGWPVRCGVVASPLGRCCKVPLDHLWSTSPVQFSLLRAGDHDDDASHHHDHPAHHDDDTAVSQPAALPPGMTLTSDISQVRLRWPDRLHPAGHPSHGEVV